MNHQQQQSTSKKRKLPPPQQPNEDNDKVTSFYKFKMVEQMNPIDVCVTFARELSCDPTVLTSICAEISTRKVDPINGSHQEAIVAKIVEMLTETVMFEITATAHGKEDFKYQLYLFGCERPLYSFSLNCIATNPTLSACIYCMLSTGYEREGMKYFKSRTATPDRSRLDYKDFTFSDLLAQHFFRSSLLLHYVMVMLSGIDIFFADQYPSMEVTKRGLVLLERVIHDVDSKLEQMKVDKTNLHENFKTTCRIVNTLVATEKTPENVKNLFSAVIAEQIRTYQPIKRE